MRWLSRFHYLKAYIKPTWSLHGAYIVPTCFWVFTGWKQYLSNAYASLTLLTGIVILQRILLFPRVIAIVCKLPGRKILQRISERTLRRLFANRQANFRKSLISPFACRHHVGFMQALCRLANASIRLFIGSFSKIMQACRLFRILELRKSCFITSKKVSLVFMVLLQFS